jgi:outer membrane protein OmpA-like peptidoglycan-associated protein
MAALAALFPFPACAEGAGLAPVPAAPFRLTERSDFSRYVDGKYLGHAYRESRGALSPASSPATGTQGYVGEFLVLEETLRDMRSASRRVDKVAPVRLSVARGGALEVQEDSGYPSLRGLPALPEGELEPGLSWTAAGTRALDFDGSGSFILIPFFAEYRYAGMADYRGEQALSLSAKFATRWKSPSSDSPIQSAVGIHELSILVDPVKLTTLFVRDRFDETFTLSGAGSGGGAGGSAPRGSERRSGFSLYFFEGSEPLDRRAAGAAMAAAVKEKEPAPAAAPSPSPVPAPRPAPEAEPLPPGAGPGPLLPGEGPLLADEGGLPSGGALGAAGLELDTSPEGLVLRVKDLRFVADSDAILGAELWRLDAIAAALKALPGRSFLVSGHSAAVGKAAGELELSIQRAKRVTEELGARGIEASRLLYRGFGSSRPLAPNDSEEGRAKNRRVEITILD